MFCHDKSTLGRGDQPVFPRKRGESRFTHVMMYPALFLDHAEPHVKSMEEDSGYPKCNLRQVEHDTGLVDEVDALGSPQSFFCRRDAIDNAWRALNLVRRERPLICHRGLVSSPSLRGWRRLAALTLALGSRRGCARAMRRRRWCCGRNITLMRRSGRSLDAGTCWEAGWLVALTRRPITVNAGHVWQLSCKICHRRLEAT